MKTAVDWAGLSEVRSVHQRVVWLAVWMVVSWAGLSVAQMVVNLVEQSVGMTVATRVELLEGWSAA